MIEKKLTFSRKSDCSPKSSCGHVEWILTTLPEILREKTKSFCSMSKSNKEEFSKKILEMHFETWNAVLTIPLKIWDKTGKMVRSPKIIKKKHIFSHAKKCFSAKSFHPHLEYISSNTDKIVLPEAAEKKTRCTEAKRKTRFRSEPLINSSSNCASGHIERCFSYHANKLCDKLPKVFCSL